MSSHRAGAPRCTNLFVTDDGIPVCGWVRIVVRATLGPSGKRLHNYGKSPFLMRKLMRNMGIFNSKAFVYQEVNHAQGSYTSQIGRNWDTHPSICLFPMEPKWSFLAYLIEKNQDDVPSFHHRFTLCASTQRFHQVHSWTSQTNH